MKNSKRGALDNLEQLVVGLGVLAILGAVIFLIIAETRVQVESIGGCENSTLVFNGTTNQCHWLNGTGTVRGGASHAFNATVSVQEATSDVPGWLPIVVITVIGGVLLALVRIFRNR